jgi:hypothetical protein
MTENKSAGSGSLFDDDDETDDSALPSKEDESESLFADDDAPVSQPATKSKYPIKRRIRPVGGIIYMAPMGERKRGRPPARVKTEDNDDT